MAPVKQQTETSSPHPSSSAEAAVANMLAVLSKRGFFATRTLGESKVEVFHFDAFTGLEEQRSALALDEAGTKFRREVRKVDWVTQGAAGDTLYLVSLDLSRIGDWFSRTTTIAKDYTSDTTWLGLRYANPLPTTSSLKLAMLIVTKVLEYGSPREGPSVRYDGRSVGRILALLAGEIQRTVNSPFCLLNNHLAKLLGERLKQRNDHGRSSNH